MHRLAMLVAVLLAACSGVPGPGDAGTGGGGNPDGGGGAGGAAGGTGGTGGGAGGAAGGGIAGGSGGGDAGGSGGGSGGGTAGGTGGGSAGGTGGGAAASGCIAPIALATLTNPVVVGNGTAASCTEAALRTAVTTATGAARDLTFDCGSSPVKITLTQTILLPDGKSLTVDGKGLITLDGGGTVRLFHYRNANFRTPTAALLTFQRLTLANGRGTGPLLAVQGTGVCSRGYELEAGGAALWARNARVRMIDVVLAGHRTPEVGPDLAGGALYVVGSVETTLLRCRFEDNVSANGGAVGVLFGALRAYDTAFINNRALGFGGNSDLASSGCPLQTNGQNQVGSGGLGGAVYGDGAEPHRVVLCGCSFLRNQASNLGGAILRMGYNTAGQGIEIDRCTFEDNVCEGRTPEGVDEGAAGGAYLQQQDVTVRATTFARNHARGAGGGLRLESARVTLENSTLYGNTLTRGIGAGLFWSGSSQGTMRNCTLAENVANGGGGFFAGAIADPGGSSIANLKIDNTLFVNNRAFDANVGMQCQKTVTTGANDLQWPQTRITGGAPDTACVQGITFVDPQLGPLTDGGVPTSKPASAGTQIGQNCPATDQHGRTRASPCTVGAVER